MNVLKTQSKKEFFIKKLLPFSLAILIFVVDHITKYLITKNIPPYTIAASYFGDLFRIVHVVNTGGAFSMGADMPQNIRSLTLSFVPLVVIVLIIVLYFRNKDFSQLQRWCICGIIGGGLGNIYDRIFSRGVVDFIDIKFFGIFGLERWPTFNIADAGIVVCGIILIISFIGLMIKERNKEEK
jgi:signal peptidase II